MGGWRRRLLAVVLVVALVEVVPAAASSVYAAPPPGKAAVGADTPVLASPAAAAAAVDHREPGVFTNPPGGPPGPKPEREAPDLVEELVSERTASSQTFRNSDGSQTTRYFDERRFFERDGEWVPIDNSVVEDPSRPGVFVNAGNDWSVSFGRLDAGGVQISSKDGDLGFAPKGGRPVAPVAGTGEDADTVTYPNVWPGVDLRYTVHGGAVKEDLILHNNKVPTAFDFDTQGEDLTADDAAPGGLRATDATASRGLRIAAPEVQAMDGRPLSGARPSMNATRGPAGSSLQVGVDRDWLAGLAASEFPVVLDPTVLVGINASDGWSYKSDGASCTGICGLRVGNSRDGGDTYWRSVVKFPYESQWGDNPEVLSATLHLSQVSGTANPDSVEANWADSWGFDQSYPCTWDGEFCWSVAYGNSVDVDVTELYDFFLKWQIPGGPITLNGNETPGFYTFKAFAGTLDITVNHKVPAAVQTAPANGAVITTPIPTLSVNPVTDRDGDPVDYWFRVATSPDGVTGQVFNSGWTRDLTSVAVPAGTLQDGRTYYWRVHTYDGTCCENTPSEIWSFRFDRRLGADGTQPFDQLGPVSVNLANGNVVVSTAGPQLPTVGGSAGVAFTYNSQAVAPSGLHGVYYPDANQNGLFDESTALAQRVDPVLDFNWGLGAPQDGVATDHWMARWSGYLTVDNTGSYQFGATVDDGIRITINGVVQTNAWPCVGTCFGNTVNLTGGQSVPITVEYYEETGPAYLSLGVKINGNPAVVVPTTWLSPTTSGLPARWSLSTADGVGWQWAMRAGSASSVVLVDPTGVTEEYKWTGSTYKPPEGSDGVLAANSDGSLTLQDGGMEYVFNPDGSLRSASTAVDDRTPAALSYAWTGTPPRLTTITDPVDPTVRKIALAYGGDAACPTTPPNGAVIAPTGMLCKVSYWDTTATNLWYDTSGRLIRVEDPGGEVTDFAYDNSSRITKVRDPLAADTVAAGFRADDDTTRTLIAYDGANRATSLNPPAGTAAGTRQTHTYDYQSGTTVVNSPHLVGTWLRKVTFDSSGRLTSTIDATGKTSSQTWDVPDRTLSGTDTAGRRSTSVYDTVGRVTDSYGPAPTSCFSGQVPNGGCTTPPVARTHTDYDQSLSGLAATYWPNITMTGIAKVHDTVTGPLAIDWGSSGPTGLGVTDNWSARFTGEILLPDAGTYTFNIVSDDGVRLYIDDTVVFDAFTGHAPQWTTGTFTAPTAGQWHRIRIDYFDQVGGAMIELHWVLPSGPSGLVPNANLNPRYGLVTTSTAYDSNGVPNAVAATGYASPHLGLATSETVDPSGLALTSTTTYEAPGVGFLRRLTRTLPSGAGSTNTYAHYGATETADNPCTTGVVEAIPQGGRPKTSTAADPDGAGAQASIVREQRYDAAGRMVASQVQGDGAGWSCTTFDSRGRAVTVAYPAFGGAPARTVTSNYAVGSNPLVSSVSDSAGTITSTVDLLGRVTSYTDVWGNVTTTTYDNLGRVDTQVSPAGTRQYTYDGAGRVETMKLDGLVIADPVYDSVGEVASVSYPTGSGNAGNGTSLSAIAKDGAGRPTALTWTLTGGASVTDSVTRSQTGKVVDETIDGVDAYTAGANFAYDASGRLTSAKVPGHTYSYGFAATGGCGVATAAGKNTNRTTLTVDGGTPVTSCYDHADRLTSTTAAGYTGTIAYDSHGNTTTLAGETRSYDATDRHLTTTKGATSVTYLRDATDRIVARTVPGPLATITPRANPTSTGLSAAGTSINLTVPAAAVVGDVLIAHVAVHGTATITAPAGWTLINTGSATTVRSSLYRKVKAAGDPTSYTWTLSSSEQAAGGMAAYGGVDTTNPVDAAATPTVSTNTATLIAPSVTTTQTGDQLVVAHGIASSTTINSGPPLMSSLWNVASTGSGNTGNRARSATYQQTLTTPGATGTRTTGAAGSVNAVNHTIALRPAPTTVTVRYGSTGPGDSAAFTQDGAGVLLETTLSLPGGVLLTKRASGNVWSYPNIHGDVIATANATGTKQGATMHWGPYGESLTAVPDNSAGAMDYGWLGQHQRPLEHDTCLTPTIEMGARQYDPTIGRFLETDLIEGGSANDYDYASGDPINNLDLDGLKKCGRWDLRCKAGKAIGGVKRGARAAAGWTGRNLSATGVRNAWNSSRGWRGAAWRGAGRVVKRCTSGMQHLGFGNAGFAVAGGGFHAAEASAILAGEHALGAAAATGGGAVIVIWAAVACGIG